MKGNETCLECPSSLICNFGTGQERGHIYVCNSCGAADFVPDAHGLRDFFLKETDHAAGKELHAKSVAFRLPSACPMLRDATKITDSLELSKEKNSLVMRPVMYVCPNCFNAAFRENPYNAAKLRNLYRWIHGREAKVIHD